MSATGDGLLVPIQNETENPRLEFRDGQFLFAMTNLEGGLCERFLSNAAVREAFSGIPVDSGWLRPEIVRWGDGRHGEWAIAFVAPAVHKLEITNEVAAGIVGVDVQRERLELGVPEVLVDTKFDILDVPLPGLVWFGLGTQYYVWAVKTAKLEPYSEIYRVPLPNVYLDGKICWGLVRPPRATARTLFDAWDLFIKSTFNNHLASGKAKSQRDDVRVKLLELAVRRDFDVRYPLDDLVRQVDQVGVTLDQAIRVFFETGQIPS